MMKKLVCMMATLFVAIAVPAQQPQTAVEDVETQSLGCLMPRANVTPYSDEDDLEAGAFFRSDNYMPLSGQWQIELHDDYTFMGDRVADRKFTPKGWAEVNIPTTTWMRGTVPMMLRCIATPDTIPQKGNITALLHRSFYVDKNWKGYHAVLRLQARSAFHLWVNHKYVGYAEDSRAIHEFDITRHLRFGQDNEVTLQVVSLSTGSLLESHYAPSYLGVTVEPAVVFYPSAHFDDFTVNASYDAVNHSGRLAVDVAVSSLNKKGRYYVEVELWDPHGREVGKMGKWIYFDRRELVTVSLSQQLEAVSPWSAERPARYTAVMRLLDEKMSPIMTTGTHFGFRTVALQDGRLMVNGSPLVLHGVAWCDNGQPEATVRQELLRMKKHNINAIRTIQYSPASEAFYDLCDELGFYVMCDANVQPYAGMHKSVASDEAYVDLFLSRVRNMYGTLKNHPSIIIWSLGRTGDIGACMTQSYRELKRLDASRPVFMQGSTGADDADFISLVNPTPQAVRQSLSRGLTRPLLVAEYGGAEGNPMGGLQELWNALSASTAGGFAASWIAYNSLNYTSNPVQVSHTGLSQRAVLGELREAFRPFDITLQSVAPDAAEFLIVNRNHTLPLSDYKVSYVLYTHLKPRIIEGEIKTVLPAGATHTFKLRIPKLTLYANEELFIRFEVRGSNIPSVDNKTVLSTVCFPLPASHVARQQLPSYDWHPIRASINDSTGILTLNTESFALDFNLHDGTLAQVSFHQKNLLQRPLQLAFHIPTTSGDEQMHKRYMLWQSYDHLRYELVDADYRYVDSSTVIVNMMLRYYTAAGLSLFDVRQQYTVFHSGDMLIGNEIRSLHPVVAPPRVGLDISLAAQVDSVQWMGLENESYSDRHADSRYGFFTATPHRLQSPRAFTRRVALMGTSAGLYLDMSDSLFSFVMQSAGTGWMLAADAWRAPAGGIVTTIPSTEPFVYSFTAHLRPFDPLADDPEEYACLDLPISTTAVLPVPVITSDRDHFNEPMQIALTLPHEQSPDGVRNMEIRYTLDGSTPDKNSPLYKEPFTISSSTTVNARTFAVGMTPSFVSTYSFFFDYVSELSYQERPNTPYNLHSESALTDGVLGSVDDLSHAWLGFSGNDMVLTIKLSKPIDIDAVRLRFAHSPAAWTFAPTAVSVATSSDGITFSNPVEADYDFDATDETNNSPQLLQPSVAVHQRGVTHLRIIARNMGRIPAWHQAKGLRSWLMTDEITILEWLP